MKDIKFLIQEFYRRTGNTKEKSIIKDIFKNNKELKRSMWVYLVEYSTLPVYVVRTLGKKYIVKVYNKNIDIFDVKKYLKEIVKYEEILKNNNVNISMPLKINGNYIFETEEYYFLVFDYIKCFSVRERGLYNPKMDLERLVDLLIQSQSIDKEFDLPFFYNEIKDYKMDELADMVEKNNIYLSKVKDDLTICHNDFRPSNILWTKKNNIPYLTDFDAVAYAYKYANLIEAAINFSYDNISINFNAMEKIFKYYFNKVKDKGDFEMAFYLSLNGKLSWLNHMISINDPATHFLVDLLKYVQSCKDKIKEIYLKA